MTIHGHLSASWHRLRSVRNAIAVALALTVGGCGAVDEIKSSIFGADEFAPPCPSVAILTDAQSLANFKPGVGRDLTDVTFNARFVDVISSCVYKQKDEQFVGVDITLQAVFEAERGPADRSRSGAFKYFVAIPQFYPNPQGRSEFAMKVGFPSNRSKLRISDAPVTINIPINAQRSGANYDVYVGFVLDKSQIELNRKRQGLR